MDKVSAKQTDLYPFCKAKHIFYYLFFLISYLSPFHNQKIENFRLYILLHFGIRRNLFAVYFGRLHSKRKSRTRYNCLQPPKYRFFLQILSFFLLIAGCLVGLQGCLLQALPNSKPRLMC